MTPSDWSSAAGVRQGDILAGKYRVERVLGQGGMGVVVAATHLQLDEKVAIKFLLPHMLVDAHAMGRFAREARAAVKIKSEHVARVFDVGTLDTGAPYIVMEYLEGGDLAGWLRQRGPLAFEQAAEFVLQACVAVAEAHALGIVHRDLKPANLFCVRRADGQLSIKVLDFGISKLATVGASAPEVPMTLTSARMGSPLYMSPEQMESSKNVDARTDIWALGVILFELLSKRTPFEGDSMPSVCLKIASQPPPPLSTFRPDAPPGLEAVILRCLEKDREQRYPNVAELGLALLPFAPKRAKASVERISGIIQAAGLSATALSVPPSPDGAGPRGTARTTAPHGMTVAGSARGKVAAGAIGILVVLSVAIAAPFAVRLLKRAPESVAVPPAITTSAGSLPEPAALAPPSVEPTSAETALVAVPSAPVRATASPTAAASTVVRPAAAKPIATAAAAVTSAVAPPATTKSAHSDPSNMDPLSRLRPK